MTQEQAGGLALEFTVADRLRKAREHIGCDQKQFAALTGISRGTIRNYESADHKTRKPYIVAQWALATGVSQQWLESGAGQPANPDGPSGTDGAPEDKLARLTARKRGSAGGDAVTRAYPEAA